MSSEADKAKAAGASKDTGAPTIFDKIISKEIPANIVYEDEKVRRANSKQTKSAPTHSSSFVCVYAPCGHLLPASLCCSAWRSETLPHRLQYTFL
jgi:hypothetical protein